MKKTLQFLVALSVAITLMLPGDGIISKVNDDPNGGTSSVNMIIEPDC